MLSSILCQKLLWWTEHEPISINILDAATKVLPMCSVYRAPSYKPIITLLPPFHAELAYLGMLFILELGHLKNKEHAQISQLQQKPCEQYKIDLINRRLVYRKQWHHVCDCISDIDGKRSIFHPPG